MSKEFIAELHDIGKLVDKAGLSEEFKKQIKRHTFEEFDFKKYNLSKPSSPSWWGQYHHKINDSEDLNSWQNIDDTTYKPDVFLLILADHLASSISRALPQMGSGGESEGIMKLWNFKFYKNEKNRGKSWAAFKTDYDVKNLFKIIDEIDSPDKFLDKYRENLLLTPEDKSIPRNITSLYTHLELVGKIYRVLKKYTEVTTDDGKIKLKFQDEETDRISDAEGGRRTTGNSNVEKGKWQARFIKCYIKIPHSFVRLQDINLLVKQVELINSFVKRHRDNVMLFTNNFISLFLPPKDEMKLEEFFKEFLDYGFFIECVETIADLGILRSNLDIKIQKARKNNDNQILTVLNNRNTKVYMKILMPEGLGEEIQPPICDICQMQPATERIKENIREWLCDNCYEIRTEGERFNYPEEWQNQKIVWLKFSLNHDKLEKWMQEAFNRYVDNINGLRDKQTLKDEFRSLACQSDFLKDYIKMVGDFWQRCNGLEIMKPISDYDEIGVCRYSGKLVKEILKKFLEIHDIYFPDCDSDANSPVSLSLSISHIKYPVREHWRYFENPKGFFNIRSQNVFEDTFTKEEIKWLMDKLSETEEASSHFLYKLIGINDKLNSDINIIVEILNNKNRHPKIYSLYSKFETSPKKILNFFRTVEEADEIIKA